MPFDKEAATVAGRKGSRAKDPAIKRTKMISVALRPEELDMIDNKAKAAGTSRTETIVRAVKEYRV